MGRHAVHLGGHHVTKCFDVAGGADREAAQREWRALELLSVHAPGLAPAPLAADLSASAPFVTMSRLPGRPLRGGSVDGGR
jgi:hypothetical protein